MTFEESMKLVTERWGAALEKLAVAHTCPDPENCSFGGQGCVTEDMWKDAYAEIYDEALTLASRPNWSEPTSTPYEDIQHARELLEKETRGNY